MSSGVENTVGWYGMEWWGGAEGNYRRSVQALPIALPLAPPPPGQYTCRIPTSDSSDFHLYTIFYILYL